ncbi:MAG: hypothetical protein ACI3W5_15705 [Faecousia sp.]
MAVDLKKLVSGGEWPPVCDCCGRQLEPGDAYYELDIMGVTVLVCDICEGEMESAPILVEEPDLDGGDPW